MDRRQFLGGRRTWTGRRAPGPMQVEAYQTAYDAGQVGLDVLLDASAADGGEDTAQSTQAELRGNT